MTDTPLTPCVNICVIHPDAGVCVGCYRTRDEIAGWSRLTDDERRAIMDGLATREILLRRRRGGRAARHARRGPAAE